MRITQFELLSAAAALAILGAVGAFFARDGGTAADTVSTEDDARRVLRAAEAWLAVNGGNGCPTLTLLQRDGQLPDDARTDDAWGERFRVVCDQKGMLVRSAGKDHDLRTDDDVVATSGSGS
jgi:hypothetical protein